VAIILGAVVIAAALFMRPAAGPTPAASPSPNATSSPAVGQAAVSTPAVTALLDRDFLILDVGDDPLTDVKVTLRAPGRTHTLTLSHAIDPHESPFLALSDFNPPAAAGRYSDVTVSYRRNGVAGEVTTPLTTLPK
jgi:hypothetical protein